MSIWQPFSSQTSTSSSSRASPSDCHVLLLHKVMLLLKRAWNLRYIFIGIWEGKSPLSWQRDINLHTSVKRDLKFWDVKIDSKYWRENVGIQLATWWYLSFIVIQSCFKDLFSNPFTKALAITNLTLSCWETYSKVLIRSADIVLVFERPWNQTVIKITLQLWVFPFYSKQGLVLWTLVGE